MHALKMTIYLGCYGSFKTIFLEIFEVSTKYKIIMGFFLLTYVLIIFNALPGILDSMFVLESLFVIP